MRQKLGLGLGFGFADCCNRKIGISGGCIARGWEALVKYKTADSCCSDTSTHHPGSDTDSGSNSESDTEFDTESDTDSRSKTIS